MERNAPAAAGPQPGYRIRQAGLTGQRRRAACAPVRDGSAQERLICLGDLLPFVPAQIWRQDPDEAMLMITDYLAMLRGVPEESRVLAIPPPMAAASLAVAS